MQPQLKIHWNTWIVDECHILACWIPLDRGCSKVNFFIFNPQVRQNGCGFDGHFEALWASHHNHSISIDIARLARNHLKDDFWYLLCCDAAWLREGHYHILILFWNVDLKDSCNLGEVLQMQFLLILLANRDFSESKFLCLANAVALRHHSWTLHLQCLAILKLHLEGLFYLCSLAQILVVEAERDSLLGVGLDDSAHRFDLKQWISWSFPLILDIILIDVLKSNWLPLLELLILVSNEEFELVFAHVQCWQDTGASYHKLEEVISIEDVLKSMLEWSFSQCFEHYIEASVGLSWQDLSFIWSLRETLMNSLKTDRDRLWVEVADMKGFLLHWSKEDIAKINDDWTNWNISELVRCKLSSDESLLLLTFGHGRIYIHKLIRIEVIEIQLHFFSVLPL